MIDSNIPLPPCNNDLLYPFADMKVGDSFLAVHHLGATAQSLSPLMNYHRKKTGFKFTQRKTPEGRRIWRTA